MRMEMAMHTSSTVSRAGGKRPTNLSLSVDVLDAARELGINVSQVCDAHLRDVVRAARERRWRDEHAAFVDAYNTTLRTEGLPLEDWKSF
jgi:antitoxin CcdA